MQQNSLPLISIITVCFNSAETIKDCLESVLAQDYANIEHIIIDGNSKDNTLDIVKSYNQKYLQKGFNFKWISEPDDGIYDAMNKGVRIAEGELIGIIGSDDKYTPSAVKTAVNHYMLKKADIMYGNLIYMYGKDNVEKKPREIKMLDKSMCLFHPSCFISKSLYKIIGNYNTNFNIAADYDFLLRAFKNGASFLYIDEALAYFSTKGISSLQVIKACKDERNVKISNGCNHLIAELFYLRKIMSFQIRRFF